MDQDLLDTHRTLRLLFFFIPGIGAEQIGSWRVVQLTRIHTKGIRRGKEMRRPGPPMLKDRALAD